MEKTRVNCFALFLLLVLLTGCSPTPGTSATVEELPEEAPSYVTELKVPTVEEVQQLLVERDYQGFDPAELDALKQ